MKDINYNKIWIGIVIGIVIPFIIYLLYYMLVAEYNLRRVNVSLCMVANLLPFYLSLNREKYEMTKGVIIATLLWGIVIAYLSFFTSFFRIL